MSEREMGQFRMSARGFTLMELMIVVVVIAILLAIAIPLYGDQVRQARRAEAQQMLMDIALEQEKFRANNTTYGDCTALFGGACDAPDNYAITVTENTATAYTIQATASGAQAQDEERGTACTPMTLDESDNKCPAVCWSADPAANACP